MKKPEQNEQGHPIPLQASTTSSHDISTHARRWFDKSVT